jgi:hypothetical protein
MNYRINIQILNQNGDELLDKQLRISSLDAILDTDLSILYAEAQQNELFDISNIKEFDDTEEYRESHDL